MTKKEEELLRDESTPTELLEKMVAEYPKFPHDIDEEIVEWLSYHPKSSADILDKIFDSRFRYELGYELVNNSNTSIETLKVLCHDDDHHIAEDAKKQLKKRGVKTKKHPLRGKTAFVVMYSHVDGCDSYVYADNEHADIKAENLKRKLGGEDGCVWIEAQEIS